MWDAAENGLRAAAQGVRVGEAPAGAAAPTEPGRGGERQDRRDYTRAPTIAQRPDSRRRPAWTTLTGILSHTRWPSLTALNWLLPLSDAAEEGIANDTTLEETWDLGYRGLVPRFIAKLLKRAYTPPDTPFHETDVLPEERRALKRIEKTHRRDLTRRVLPSSGGSEGLHIDLFGHYLSSGSESETAGNRAPDNGRADVQAALLGIVQSVYGHMA